MRLVKSMGRVIEKLIAVSLVPIVALNILGGITGGIWLLVLGEWKLVLIAVLVGVAFPFAYSAIILFQTPLAGLTLHLREKNRNVLASAIGFISMLIGHAINLAWVTLVFFLALKYSEGQNVIAYLLFGWEVAVGPFQYMARGEPPDSVGTYVALYLLGLSYLILALFYFLSILSFALPLIIVITLAAEVYLLKVAFGESSMR